MLKFYERNIAEGRNFLGFATFFAVLVRLIYYFDATSSTVSVAEGGLLWTPLIPIFSNLLYSLIASTVVLIFIAVTVNYVNTEHAFIRRRTLLPSAIVILLFSCMPSELVMSPYYIAAWSMVVIVGALFAAQTSGFKQGSSTKITLHLVLGSLFAPVLLLYLPIIWVCMARLRCLNAKAFLASVFTAFIVYVPVLSYFLLTNSLEVFYQPFQNIINTNWESLPVLHYSIPQFVLLAIVSLLYLIILIDTSVSSFKDKIRVRAFSAVLTIIVLTSFLFTLLLNVDSDTTLFIGLAVGSLQVAHFFSLAEKKITKYIFFFYFLILIILSLNPSF